MTRIEFTANITHLLQAMIAEEGNVILDYCKRSTEEQKRLFECHKSQCDGEIKKSKHQYGMAADIYFIEDAKLVEPKRGWSFWHDEWCSLGGKPKIDWDLGHFEG
jgi:hypothetical protein